MNPINEINKLKKCICDINAQLGGGGCDLEFLYNPTEEAEPESGFIAGEDFPLINSGDIYISENDVNGVDISSILATIHVGDVIKITNSNHSGSYVFATVTEEGTDEGGFWTFAVNIDSIDDDTWEAGDPLCLTIFDSGGAVPTLAEVLLTSADAGGGVITNGGIAPTIKITAANYTVGTTNLMELYGGIIYVTAAATLTIPAVDADMHFTVVTIGNVAVSVDPNAADLIYLDGVALSDGDKITNLSTAGDIAVFSFFDANGFYASTNGWTDTN